MKKTGPVHRSVVAVDETEGYDTFSLTVSPRSSRHTESEDERAPRENISALGASALPG